MTFMVLVVYSLYLSEVQGKNVTTQRTDTTQLLVSITSSPSFLTGAADTTSVLQTPAFIIKRDGDSHVSGINCSHRVPRFQVILWYKQDETKALKLLGYLNNKFSKVEDDVKGKMSIDGDGSAHSSLGIADVVVNDSGVYFCAASLHSAADSPQLNTQSCAISHRREERCSLGPRWWAEELTPPTLLHGRTHS